MHQGANKICELHEKCIKIRKKMICCANAFQNASKKQQANPLYNQISKYRKHIIKMIKEANNSIKALQESKQCMARRQFYALQKALLENRQYLRYIELDLYILGYMSQPKIAAALNIPVRSVENHFAWLEMYRSNSKSIPENKITVSIREAAIVHRFLSDMNSDDFKVPKNIRAVIKTDPSKMLFTLTENELNELADTLLICCKSDDCEAAAALKTIKDLKNKMSDPDFIKRYDDAIKKMRQLSKYFMLFLQSAKMIGDRYSLYLAFIEEESKTHKEAAVFEKYVSALSGDYQDIADEFGISNYKVRKTVKEYEDRFEQYYNNHKRKEQSKALV